jgi:hypothetical protein
LRSTTRAIATYLPPDTCPSDPDLAIVVEGWASLPEAVRAGILAMVRASKVRAGK